MATAITPASAGPAKPTCDRLPAGPNSITSGPDGALWYTYPGGIGRVTTSGGVRVYPTAGHQPELITSGADGALWFTEVGGVGRIDVTGSVSHYQPTVAREINCTDGIALGTDGRVWFTEKDDGLLGRVDTAGAIDFFAIPPTVYSVCDINDLVCLVYPVTAKPVGIVGDPSGGMFFTNLADESVDHVKKNGVVNAWNPIFSETVGDGFGEGAPSLVGGLASWGGSPAAAYDGNGCPSPAPNHCLAFYNSSTKRFVTSNLPARDYFTGRGFGKYMVQGADGRLWATAVGAIGAVAGDGASSSIAIGGTAEEITAGPDGRLWFAESSPHRIGAITTSGVVTEYAVP
jgi:streptogramin lyase